MVPVEVIILGARKTSYGNVGYMIGYPVMRYGPDIGQNYGEPAGRGSKGISGVEGYRFVPFVALDIG